MYKILALLTLCFALPSFAQSQNHNLHILFDSPYASMTYPSVSDGYLVYSQRIKQSSQVMRLKLSDLNGSAKDISPSIEKEFIRQGIAISDGDIAYVSNHLQHIAPWLSHRMLETSVATGTFQGTLLPNHLDVSQDATTWVFDSPLENTRIARITNQFTDAYLNTQLTGQAWRMYHSKFWTIKSDYPASKSGVTSKFQQPLLYTIVRGNNDINSLGDGFDASLSPEGKSLVFVRESKGNFDLWQQNIDGSNLKRLTKNTFADLEPALSPDGTTIVFISNRDAAGDILRTSIYVLNIATGKITRITSGNVIDGGPAWLDNTTIIFHSNRDPQAPKTNTVDNWRLWTVTLPK